MVHQKKITKEGNNVGIKEQKGERQVKWQGLNLSLPVTKGKEMKTLQLKGRDWQKVDNKS